MPQIILKIYLEPTFFSIWDQSFIKMVRLDDVTHRGLEQWNMRYYHYHHRFMVRISSKPLFLYFSYDELTRHVEEDLPWNILFLMILY